MSYWYALGLKWHYVFFDLQCEVMYPDAVLVAVDGCVTFVPLHKSHPPPSLPRIFLHSVTMWLGVCHFIREVGTCSLERGSLVQPQPLYPKTRVKYDWSRMDTSQPKGRSRRKTSHRSHMSFNSHPAAVRWQTAIPYFLVTCCHVSAGLPHSAHVQWEVTVVSSCWCFYNLPLE